MQRRPTKEQSRHWTNCLGVCHFTAQRTIEHCLPRAHRIINMRGLINVGTHCAVNSVLQCLYVTDDFRITYSTVASELTSVLRDMDRNTPGMPPCDPNPLVDALIRYSGMTYEVQQDADTVFKCVLNALADDGDPRCKQASGLWTIRKQQSAKCSTCNAECVSHHAANNVIVYIGNNEPNKLQDYMDDYSETFRVSDYHCGTCQEETELNVTTDITELPAVLCFTVARGQRCVQRGELMVNTGAIDVPEELDCSRMCATSQPTKYELYGMITHTGPYEFSHYAAFVKKMSKWYFVDGDVVKQCPVLPLSYYNVPAHLYMLMYRRI
uniref:Ubiquitin carboxyl-terminal hydrolase 30 n=1 Tax=Oreochromis niloticus TaxID=8128 RepID=A0A669D8L2_ORENI